MCNTTGHTYIGATINLKQRRQGHWALIRQHTFIDKTLAALCREHGPDSMEWKVLEEVPEGEGIEERLQSAEWDWMIATRQRIGNLLVNNPNNRYRSKADRGKTTTALMDEFKRFCLDRGVVAKEVLHDLLNGYMQKPNGKPATKRRAKRA